MHYAVWTLLCLIAGFAVSRYARHDVARQRELKVVYGEAHVADTALTPFVVWAMLSLIMILAHNHHHSFLETLMLFGVSFMGLRLSIIDIDTHTIPQRLLLPSVGILLVGAFVVSVVSADVHIIEVIVGGGAMWLVMRIVEALSRGDLGHADVSFACFLGIFLGVFGVALIPTALIISFVAAGLVALVMVVTRRMSMKTHLPFGPFLFFGAIVVVLR